MSAAIFPWPSRAERKSRIEDARRGTAAARRGTAEAEKLTADLNRIFYQDNHLAQIIAEGIVGGHQRRGKGGNR